MLHHELLSWLRVASAVRPVSARSGRKEFIEADDVDSTQGDSVLPADTAAP